MLGRLVRHPGGWFDTVVTGLMVRPVRARGESSLHRQWQRRLRSVVIPRSELFVGKINIVNYRRHAVDLGNRRRTEFGHQPDRLRTAYFVPGLPSTPGCPDGVPAALVVSNEGTSVPLHDIGSRRNLIGP